MRSIVIQAAKPSNMRYDTLGDWRVTRGGTLMVTVAQADPSAISDEGFLVALHELIEAKLCLSAGITQAAVDAFDLAFQGDGEPGDDPAAPYREQHRRAMLVEHLVADWLGIKGYGEVR